MILESAAREIPFTETELDIHYRYGTLRNKLTFQPKREDNPRPAILGFDTETFEDADPLCYCTSDGRFLWTFGGPFTMDALFSLLASHNRSLYFTWNLAFDVMVLLKTVSRTSLTFEDDKELRLEAEGVKLDYMYRKSLRLSKGHRTVVLYDASPLYGKGSLEDMATKYLGEGKKYEGPYQNKAFPKTLSKQEATEILDYCIRDAKLTARLAEQWIDTFAGEFGFYPKKYFSAGSIMAEHVERTISTFPTFTVAPYKVQKAAFATYYGGRFEVFRRGTFENIHHYDINSAYPYAISLLPDLSKGIWRPYHNENGGFSLVGFFKIEANIPPTEKIGPFMFRLGLKVFSPVGRFVTWATSEELRQVPRDWFTILEGFEWQGPEAPCELAGLMGGMFEIRAKKEEPKRSVYRILINSIYGKTAQTKPKVGRLFSPVVCSYITGFCRAMIYKAMVQKPNDIVACATDGVFSLAPLDLPIGKGLGQWSYTPSKRLVFFMNGLYFEDEKVRSRGFSPKIVHEDNTTTLLTPDDVQVYEKEGRAYFKIVNRKPNSLLESLHSKSKIMAKFDLREREIDINGDTKRVWERPLKTLSETTISYPLVLGT